LLLGTWFQVIYFHLTASDKRNYERTSDLPKVSRSRCESAGLWKKPGKPQKKVKVEKEMNMNDKIIAVTGATGQQGGAVARKLPADGWKVRALTRDANKLAAKDLASRGAEIVAGDMENRSELDAAFKGAYGVFSVQYRWTQYVTRSLSLSE
jgi:hypothetical protein